MAKRRRLQTWLDSSFEHFSLSPLRSSSSRAQHLLPRTENGNLEMGIYKYIVNSHFRDRIIRRKCIVSTTTTFRVISREDLQRESEFGAIYLSASYLDETATVSRDSNRQ